MNWLELIASVLGIVSVYFVVRRNVLAFPIGMVMVSLYAIVFYQAKYYADMALQVIYIGMQAQGWLLWRKGQKASDFRIAVRRLGPSQWLYSAVALAAGTLAAGMLLRRYTDASLPYLDAFTTALSLIAQWWMNKRYLENWLLWILADAVYLYQYSYKSLYMTTALYAIFLILAVAGFREWRRIEKSG